MLYKSITTTTFAVLALAVVPPRASAGTGLPCGTIAEPADCAIYAAVRGTCKHVRYVLLRAVSRLQVTAKASTVKCRGKTWRCKISHTWLTERRRKGSALYAELIEYRERVALDLAMLYNSRQR